MELDARDDGASNEENEIRGPDQSAKCQNTRLEQIVSFEHAVHETSLCANLVTSSATFGGPERHREASRFTGKGAVCIRSNVEGIRAESHPDTFTIVGLKDAVHEPISYPEPERVREVPAKQIRV